MKLNAISAIALGYLLSGCEYSDTSVDNVTQLTQKDIDEAVEKEAYQETLRQVDSEQRELRSMVEQAKKADPNITDAYYTIDSNGEKVLNVVRESDNDSSLLETMLIAGAVGMGASYLFNHINSNSNYHNPTYRNSMYQSQVMSREQERERRSAAYTGYVNNLKTQSYAKIKSNPAKLSSVTTKTLSTKQAAFKSTGSARASASSAG